MSAVDLDEWSAGPLTFIMYELGDEFLSGTAFAGDKNGSGSWCHFSCQRYGLSQRRACAYDIVKTFGPVASCDHGLRFMVGKIDIQDVFGVFWRDRLDKKFRIPGPYRIECGLCRVGLAYHYNRQLGTVGFYAAQQLSVAVLAGAKCGEFVAGEYHVPVILVEVFEGLLFIWCDGSAYAPVRKGLKEDTSCVLVVVYYQDVITYIVTDCSGHRCISPVFFWACSAGTML